MGAVGDKVGQAWDYMGERWDQFQGWLSPEMPEVDLPADNQPSLSDTAVRNAKLQERRRQLGLQGRTGTFLTGPFGDRNTPDTASQPTLLSGD